MWDGLQSVRRAEARPTSSLDVLQHLPRRAGIFAVWLEVEIFLQICLRLCVFLKAHVQHPELIVSRRELVVGGNGLLQHWLGSGVLAGVDQFRRIIEKDGR